MTTDAIKRLFEERQNAVTELRSLVEAADGREFTAEEAQSEERMHKAIADLDERIKNGLAILEREAEMGEARSKFEGLLRTPKEEKSTPSEETVLRSIMSGDIKGHEFRDLTKGSAAAGGNTVPTTMLNRLFENLRFLSPILSTNVTQIRTDGGDTITFPSVTAYSAASLVGEGAAIPESDPAFGLVSLGAYKYGFITQLSSELASDSGVDILGFVSRQGAVGLANGLNVHLITGTGSGQPQGLINVTTGVTAAGAAAITADELIALYHSVLQPYRNNGTWLMNDSTVSLVRRLKDSTGQYLWSPGMTAGTPDTLFGRPVVTDPNMPAATTGNVSVIFGDLSGYYVRFVGGVRIDRSDDFAFANDLITLRFLMRADAKIVDTVGIRKLVQA